ncbi:MAG: PilZ domain-containing protein [Acidobacteriia bacterium]|nr:PilZ domain-containing protein [Terriglobia bacterium]
MGRRQYKRLRLALPVTISGFDSNGNRYTQSATTAEIGVNGMRLRAVRCLRAPGELVQVEYQGRRARYRVAWIGAKGTCWEGLVGLQGLEGAKFLFSDHLPPTACSLAGAVPDTYTAETAPPPDACPDHAAIERREEERRRQPRYSCAGSAKLWEVGNQHSSAGRVNEISRGGCYVEIMAPMRTGTAIRLELSVSGRTLHLEGIVRTSQPMFGMGVEFTRMAPAEAARLCHIVSELSGKAPDLAAAETPKLSPASPEQVGEAVMRWFGLHETLTREEFLKLMEQPARVELTRA